MHINRTTFVLALALLGLLPSVANAQAWYGTPGWVYRKAITIDNAGVSAGPHINFPVLISRADTDLQTKAQADADDILFTSADGTTKLAHEVEAYTSGTGTLVAWVQIPSLSSAVDTVIYMYYGNAAATSQQNVTGTWNTNYRGVWHLNNSYLDATSNNADGANTHTTNVTGRISNGSGFNPTNGDGADYITITGMLGNPTSYTLSAWANLITIDPNAADIISLGDHSVLRYDVSNGKVNGVGQVGAATWVTTTSTTNYATGWHYVVYVFNDGGNSQQVYIDGQPNGAATTQAASPYYTGGGTNTFIGKHGNANVNMDFYGTIDEARVSNTNRSAGWILTDYNTQNSPGTFYAVGTEAKTYYSLASGNWNAAATWSNISHTGAAASTAPGSADYVVIGNSDIVTLTANATNNTEVEINSTGTLNMATFTISGTGPFSLNSGGDLGIGSTAGITSSGATGNVQVTGTRTFSTGADYTYNGTLAQVTGNGLPATVNNLTISNAAGVTSSSSVVVSSDLTVSTGTLNLSTFTANRATAGGTLTVADGATLMIGGTNSFPTNYSTRTLGVTSTVNYSGTAQAVGAQNYGHLTLSNSGLKTFGTVALSNIRIAGALTISGTATTDLITNTTNVSYNGSGAQTINVLTYYDLTASTSGTKTLAGNVIVNNSLAVANSAILDLGSFTANRASAGGTITLSSTATMRIGGTNTLPSNYSTHVIGATTTVEYNGTTQSVAVLNSAQDYGNLTISGSLTKTLAGTENVAGNLTISAGTFDLGANTINRTTAGGTLTVSNGAALEIGGTNTIPTNYTAHSIGATSTIEYGGTTQSVIVLNSAQNYGNLTISGSGTKTLAATISVAGDLTISAGTFDLGSFTANRASPGGTLSVASSATLKIGGTNTLPSNYSTHSLAFVSVIEYGGTNQTVAALNSGQEYNGLTISGSGTKTLAGDLNIAGTLTLTSGTLTTGAYTIYSTVSGNVFRVSGWVNGNLKRWIQTGAPARIFDVGDVSNYTPVTVVFASVTTGGDLTVSVASGDHANIGTSSINPALSVNRNWTLTNSGIVFTNYSATFTFVPTDVDGTANTSAFTVGKYSAGWTYPTVGTKTATTTQATGLTAFSDFAIGEMASNTKTWDGGAGTSNWGDAANWNTDGVPTSTNDVDLTGADTININVAAVANNLTLNNAGLTLTVNSGNSLVVSGNLTLTSGTLNTANSFPTVTGTINVASGTVGFTGSGAQAIPAYNYYNLTSSSTGGRTLASSGTIGIAGTFTPGTNTYTITGSTISYNAAGAQTIAAFNYNNLTLATSGAKTFAAGTSGVASTLSITGSATANATTNSSVISYNGSTNQTISALTYYGLNVSSTGGTVTGISTTVTDFSINSGTLDLNTFTLTNTGIATFTSGTINNGTVTSTGATTTFAGTVFGATVNATSNALHLNGSTFNNTVTLTKNGATDILSAGGNTFNNAATIAHSGTGYLALGNTAPDIFNADVAFTNTGSAALYVAFNSAGNQFNGNVTFNNTGTGSSIQNSFGPVATAVYSGNIIVNNTSAVGISFGGIGGLTTLAATKTISIGGTGFTTGTLYLFYFTQTGTTPQALTLTGTATLTVGPSATFNGSVNFISPQIYLNGATFNGTAYIEKNGATQNNSLGGNVFNGATTLVNSSIAHLVFGFPTGVDIFNGDLTLTNTGTAGLYLAYNTAGHQFNGNIILNQTTGANIYFNGGTGTSTLATGKTISVGGSGFSSGALNLPRFTQAGPTAQTFSLTGTALLEIGPATTFNGNLNVTAPQLVLNGGTFNGTAALTKNGATDNTGTGGSTFNSTATITNSGAGFLRLANTTADDFNGDATFVQTGAGLLQPAYASNSTFAGNLSTTGTATAISLGTGAGTVTLNGAGAQSIVGSFPTTFNNLTISNGSGITLGTNATVNSVLTFTSGTVTTNANSLYLGSAGSVSRTSGHVVGNFKKNVATGATSKTFEVGDANYTPVTVAFASVTTAGDLTARTTSGDHANIGTSTINASTSVNRSWTLTNSGIAFTNYNATFTFVAGDVDGGATTSNFIAGEYSAGWTYPTVGTKTSTTTEATGVTTFGDFQLGEAGLPPPSVAHINSVIPAGAQLPGTDLVYTATFTNSGGQPAQSFIVVEAIPTHTDFKLGSPSTVLGTTGMTVTVEYSNDIAVTWTYTPVSGGGSPVVGYALPGYDRMVTHVRWRFTGNLPQTAPNNAGSVTVTTRIQ